MRVIAMFVNLVKWLLQSLEPYQLQYVRESCHFCKSSRIPSHAGAVTIVIEYRL